MADSNEIKIILSADASELKSESRQASDAIDKLGTAAARGNKSLENLGITPVFNLKKLDAELRTLRNTLNSGFAPAINKIGLTPQNFSLLARSSDQLSGATGRLKINSNAAALALTDIGRISQDLPYGFMGIQNNLNPLLESFRRLKLETGSTGGALKALAGSLIGVGGIGLAVSVAASAFTIYQSGIAGFNKKTKEAKDQLKDFIESLRSVNDLTLESSGSVEGQISRVASLAAVVKNLALSEKQRKNALESLRSVSKNYFGDLKNEADSLKTLKGRVDEYTQALIANAVVKGFENDISKIAPELQKQEKAFSSILPKVAEYLRTQDLLGEQAFKNIAAGSIDPVALSRLRDYGNANSDILTQYSEQAKSLGELRNAMFDLQTGMKEAVTNASKFMAVEEGSSKGIKKETDALKDQISTLEELQNKTGLLKVEKTKLLQLKIDLVLRDGLKQGLNQGQIDRLVNNLQAQIDQSQISTLQLPLAIIPRANTNVSGIASLIPANFNAPMQKALEGAGKAAGDAFNKGLRENLGKDINSILQNNVTDAFTSLAEGFGSALGSTGNLGEAITASAQTFLSVVGSVLQEIGKKVIMTSKLVMALKAALSKAFVAPQAGLVAGLALFAAGTAMRNLKFNFPKLAQGGMVMGPTLATVGDAGPELIVPFNRVNQFMNGDPFGGNVVFEISGTNLRGVLLRAEESNSRRGGSSSYGYRSR